MVVKNQNDHYQNQIKPKLERPIAGAEGENAIQNTLEFVNQNARSRGHRIGGF